MGRFLRNTLLGATALLSLPFAIPPGEPDFDAEAPYAPNSIQQEFMRLAAQEFDYVALGDTNHTRQEINVFAMSPEMTSAIYAGGDRHVFLEVGPRSQDRIERLQNGEDGAYVHGNSSMWVCSQDIRDRMTDTFTEAVRANPDLEFIGADQRHGEDSPMRDSWRFNLFINQPLRLYSAIHGCVDIPAFIPGTILGMPFGLTGEMDRVIKDDRATAEYIMSYEGGGTIFYGAAHFKEEGGAQEYPMTRIFAEAGKSVTVINVYSDIEQTRDFISEPHAADAYMLVTPTEDNPDGIYVNDPELQVLYDQARENVAAKQAPLPVPEF